LVSPSNADLLLREWGAYLDLDCNILLEKSPPNIVHSRFLQALLSGARFIFIVRHPIPVAYGTLKWAKTSVVDLILHWCEAHRILLEDFDRLDRAIIIRYEDFVSCPQRLLEILYEFAGLLEIPLSEMVSDHNGAYFARWQSDRTEVIAELQDRFKLEIGVLPRFGYDLLEPDTERASALITTP